MSPRLSAVRRSRKEVAKAAPRRWQEGREEAASAVAGGARQARAEPREGPRRPCGEGEGNQARREDDGASEEDHQARRKEALGRFRPELAFASVLCRLGCPVEPTRDASRTHGRYDTGHSARRTLTSRLRRPDASWSMLELRLTTDPKRMASMRDAVAPRVRTRERRVGACGRRCARRRATRRGRQSVAGGAGEAGGHPRCSCS